MAPALRQRQGSTLIVIALVGAAVLITTVTGIFPPPPNPFADSDPTVVNRTGADIIADIRVTEPSRAGPRLRVRTTGPNETITLALYDSNGTLLDSDRAVDPGTTTVELHFIPTEMAEIEWTPTNPYTLRATGHETDHQEIVRLRIPYAAK